MSKTLLRCDQAIFTSVRTPMGEGYRIIAASKGLKPAEKQEITRNSPSHEALCHDADADEDSPLAVAFYPLNTGRRCVAMSRFAGAEQTGRGGQRVYTHIVVFEPSDLAACGFNPLRVLRALVAGAGSELQLDAPNVLPELELSVDSSDSQAVPPLTYSARMHILRAILDGDSLVMAMPGDWLSAAEGLLLGLPGPLRVDVSFGAGLQFSLSRLHRLNLLSDDKGKAKLRTTGQAVEYLNADNADVLPPAEPSSWLAFVERCYASGDMARLHRRTSRAYEDITPAGCERIGDAFETIDRMPECDCRTMLAMAPEAFAERAEGAAGELQAELIEAIKRCLPKRLAAASADEVCQLWEPIVALWRRPGSEAEFAQTVLACALSRIADEQPVRAGGLAAGIAEEAVLHAQASRCESMFEQLLARLLLWVTSGEATRPAEAVSVVRRWQQVRPDSQTVQELCRACEPVAINTDRA